MDEKKAPPSDSDCKPSEAPPPYIAAAREHGIPLRQSAPVRRGGGGGPPSGPPGPPQPLDLPIVRWMKSHRVILASASPRRRAMLAQLGLGEAHVEVRPSTKPENLDKAALGPHAYVAATAEQKALDVYEACVGRIADGTAGEDEKARGDPDLVVAADTVIVTRDGAVLEKPPSEAAHGRMLRMLRDQRAHKVVTAVCAIAPREDAQAPGYCMGSHLEETRVVFARAADGLPDDVIDAYVRTREGADKAGGYAVQGLGGMLLVERVEGSVDNVVGLPVRQCLQLCERVVFRQDEFLEGQDSAEEEEEG